MNRRQEKQPRCGTVKRLLRFNRAQNIREGRIHLLFYSNDHEPIHVHVRKGNGEAVFLVEDEVFLRESEGLKVAELAKAESLAEVNRELIIRSCHEYFDRL